MGKKKACLAYYLRYILVADPAAREEPPKPENILFRLPSERREVDAEPTDGSNRQKKRKLDRNRALELDRPFGLQTAPSLGPPSSSASPLGAYRTLKSSEQRLPRCYNILDPPQAAMPRSFFPCLSIPHGLHFWSTTRCPQFDDVLALLHHLTAVDKLIVMVRNFLEIFGGAIAKNHSPHEDDGDKT